MKEVLSVLLEYYSFYWFLAVSVIVGIWFIRKKNVLEDSFNIWSTVFFYCINSVLCILPSLMMQYLLRNDIGNYRILLFSVSTILSGIWGMISILLSKKILSCFLSLGYKSFYKKNIYGILIFIVLFTTYIIRLPNLHYWSIWSYAVNYSMGFGSRFLIGSLLSLLSAGHITNTIIYIFCFVISTVIIAIVSYLLNKVIINSSREIKLAIVYIVICFILLPGSITSFWTEENYGRLDMYVFLVSLLSVIGFRKIKNTYLKYLFLAITALICNLIYQGFIFMYFSIYVIMMAEDILKDGKISKKRLLLALPVVLVTAGSFIALQFFKQVHFSDAEEMIACLSAITDIPITEAAIKSEFFDSSFRLYDYMLNTLKRNDALREHGLVYIFFSVPQIIIFLRIVIEARRKEKQHISLFLKSPVFLSLLTLGFILPQFAINIDWGRWMASTEITAVFLILYLSYSGNQDINSVLTSFSDEIKKRKFIFSMVPVYIAGFSTLEGAIFSKDFNIIIKVIKNIILLLSNII